MAAVVGRYGSRTALCSTLGAVTTRVGADRPRTLTMVGGVLWIAAALGFFLCEAIAAAAIPAYSYANNYISVLGVPAWSPRAVLMHIAFYVQAILFLAGAVLVVRGVQAGKAVLFLGLAATNAIGNILVGTVHTAPAAGDGFDWHFLGAMLAIVGGNAAILAGSAVLWRAGGLSAYRTVSVALAVLGFGCLVAIWIDKSHAVLPIGIWERGSVYSILIWQTYTGVYLITRRLAGR